MPACWPASEEHLAEPADLALGYRTSGLKGNPAAIVLEATFALHGGRRNALLDEIARDAELRRDKHPLDYASCGSYFKNPSRELPAAKLIDELGLKGFRFGNAEVSRDHANFIVAHPGAGADDIRRVAAEVRRRVFEHSGVRLEEEVVLLGLRLNGRRAGPPIESAQAGVASQPARPPGLLWAPIMACSPTASSPQVLHLGLHLAGRRRRSGRRPGRSTLIASLIWSMPTSCCCYEATICIADWAAAATFSARDSIVSLGVAAWRRGPRSMALADCSAAITAAASPSGCRQDASAPA